MVPWVNAGCIINLEHLGLDPQYSHKVLDSTVNNYNARVGDVETGGCLDWWASHQVRGAVSKLRWRAMKKDNWHSAVTSTAHARIRTFMDMHTYKQNILAENCISDIVWNDFYLSWGRSSNSDFHIKILSEQSVTPNAVSGSSPALLPVAWRFPLPIK